MITMINIICTYISNHNTNTSILIVVVVVVVVVVAVEAVVVDCYMLFVYAVVCVLFKGKDPRTKNH